MSESQENDPQEQLLARASRLLQQGRHDDAIALADGAVRELLQPWLSVDEFIRLALRRSPVETLLRVDRKAVARSPALLRPIALRWEALRRSGRVDEARQMREVCLLLFPERASVWATAGNQALDEDHVNRANHYFDRCLALAPNWTAGLAGKAIVLERRKDFRGALPYRERVVQVERALARDDPPSLQRVVRLAAALGRVGLWEAAAPLFHHVAARDGFIHLPAERPVLLRVFSRELYAPAKVAAMIAHSPDFPIHESDELSLALSEADALKAAYGSLDADASLDTGKRLARLGLCAWLAGDLTRAYALLDEAEEHAPDDLMVQHLLACSAHALGVPERSSIVRFAHKAASLAVDRAQNGAALADEARFYALATLARFDSHEAASAAIAALPGPPGAFVSLLLAARPPAQAARLAPEAGLGLVAGLCRVGAFRLAAHAQGRSAHKAARESHDALRALFD